MPRKKTTKPETPTIPVENYDIEIKYNDCDGMEQIVHAKKSLNLSEQCALLNSIVDDIFTDGTYQPIFKDYSTRFEVVNYFTDYKFSEVHEENYKNIMESNLFDCINDVHKTQIEYILNILDEMIEHKKKCIENKSEFDVLCTDINSMIKEYASKFNDKDVKNIKKIINKFATADIQTLIQTLAERIKNRVPKDNVVNLIPKEKS